VGLVEFKIVIFWLYKEGEVGYNKIYITTPLQFDFKYRTRAIISRGLYTFYPFFEDHLCTVTFGLMYG
jgi:hypothetical protein